MLTVINTFCTYIFGRSVEVDVMYKYIYIYAFRLLLLYWSFRFGVRVELPQSGQSSCNSRRNTK